MPVIVKIAFVIFIVISPFPLIFHQQGIAGTNSVPAVSGMSYNFSGMHTGAFPSNNSWARFSLEDRSHITASVDGSGTAKGLVVTCDYFYRSSYFWMNMSLGLNATVSIDFSWNTNSSHSLTEDSISMFYGNIQAGNISFGPEKGYSTLVSDGSGVHNLGPQPTVNRRYQITASLSGSGGNAILFTISSGSSTESLPQKMSGLQNYAGRLGLRIGGRYSNLTVYSVKVSNDSFFPYPVSAGMPSGASIQDRNLSLNQARDSAFAVDTRLNSLVYAGTGGTVRVLNYFNGTDRVLLHPPEGFSMDRAWSGYHGGTFYITESNMSTLMFYSVSSSNLSCRLDGMISHNTSGINIFRCNNTVGILGPHLDLGIWQISPSQSRETSQLSLSSGQDTSLLSAATEGAYAQFLTEYNGTVYRHNVSLCNGTETVSQNRLQYEISEVFSPRYYNGSMASGWETATGTLIVFYGRGYHEIPSINGTLGYIASCGNRTSVTTSTGVYVLGNSSSTRYSNGLPSKGSFLALPGGCMLEIENGTLVLLGEPFAFSSDRISLTVPGDFTARGISRIVLNVSTPLDYVSSLSLDGKYFSSSGDAITFNSSEFPDNAYAGVVFVRNLAGYQSEKTVNISVDNRGPLLIMSPSSGTYVSGSQEMYYNISSRYGVSSIVASYLSRTVTLAAGGGHFSLGLVNFSGNFSMTVRSTDLLGESNTQVFAYTAIPANFSGFHLNIRNGSYLNSTVRKLTWKPVNWTSEYVIHLGGRSSEFYYSTNGSATVRLPEGRDYIAISGKLLDGRTVALCNITVIVIAYSPHLEYSMTGDSEYSFYGNSENNSMVFNVSSNVSSAIRIDVTNPDGSTVLERYSNNSSEITVGEYCPGFSMNGIYMISVLAFTPSGTYSRISENITVNNTVPVAPFNSFTYYTRNGTVNIPLQRAGYMRYSIEQDHNGIWTSLQPHGETVREAGQGIYRITVEEITRSGNTNSSSIGIYYYNRSPSLAHLSFPPTLTYTSEAYLNYSILDAAPLLHMAVTSSRAGVNVSTAGYSGNLSLLIPDNGIFSFNLSVEDRCGNEANFTFNITDRYYVSISESSIASEIIGSTGTFSVRMQGNIGHEPHIQWYVNGNPAGQGQTISTNLAYGGSQVEAVLSFNGVTLVDRTSVFCMGFIPEVVIAVSGIIYAAFWSLTRNNDNDVLLRILSDMRGRSLKDIFRAARKARFRSSSTRKAVRSLVESGVFCVSSDLSGKLYLMPSDLQGKPSRKDSLVSEGEE
ncbi:MAG: hypothetical protein M1148_02835 [Candidatus Thermoplasmatota archaeon]|nr:hypothetical protein [Candidatus Thermoplasmatota archaeon]